MNIFFYLFILFYNSYFTISILSDSIIFTFFLIGFDEFSTLIYFPNLLIKVVLKKLSYVISSKPYPHIILLFLL